jgi:hypothetical protein
VTPALTVHVPDLVSGDLAGTKERQSTTYNRVNRLSYKLWSGEEPCAIGEHGGHYLVATSTSIATKARDVHVLTGVVNKACGPPFFSPLNIASSKETDGTVVIGRRDSS